MTAAVCEPRNRLKGFPQTVDAAGPFDAISQRLDRVALPIQRVPVRNQAARFCKHQEQYAIHDGE